MEEKQEFNPKSKNQNIYITMREERILKGLIEKGIVMNKSEAIRKGLEFLNDKYHIID